MGFGRKKKTGLDKPKMWFLSWDAYDQVDSGGKHVWNSMLTYFDPRTPDELQPHLDKALKEFKGKEAEAYMRQVIDKLKLHPEWGPEPSVEDLALGFAIEKGRFGDKGTFIGLHPAVSDGLGSRSNSRKKDAIIPDRPMPDGSLHGIRAIPPEKLPDELKVDGLIKDDDYTKARQRIDSGKRYWERTPDEVKKERDQINHRQQTNPELAARVQEGLTLGDQKRRMVELGRKSGQIDSQRQKQEQAKRERLGLDQPEQSSKKPPERDFTRDRR